MEKQETDLGRASLVSNSYGVDPTWLSNSPQVITTNIWSDNSEKMLMDLQTLSTNGGGIVCCTRKYSVMMYIISPQFATSRFTSTRGDITYQSLCIDWAIAVRQLGLNTARITNWDGSVLALVIPAYVASEDRFFIPTTTSVTKDLTVNPFDQVAYKELVNLFSQRLNKTVFNTYLIEHLRSSTRKSLFKKAISTLNGWAQDERQKLTEGSPVNPVLFDRALNDAIVVTQKQLQI